jgi:mandelamide amidase
MRRVLAAIDRIGRDAARAFVHVDIADARAQAARIDDAAPLAGCVLGVKDNIHVAGMPCTSGTPALTGFMPPRDASVVARLKAAGAVVVGKTQMHELAYGVTGIHAAWGTPRNSADAARVPGGSSSGSAVAVALDLCDAALGTDAGGSLAIPAAFNGICSLRPTQWRYPQDGQLPMAPSRDTIGPMAPSLAMVARLDAIITGETALPWPDRPRLGVDPQGFSHGDAPEIRHRMEQWLQRAEAAGVEVVAVDLDFALQAAELHSYAHCAYENYFCLLDYLDRYAIDVSVEQLADQIACDDVRQAFANTVLRGGGRAPSEAAYLQHMQQRRRCMRRMRALLMERGIQALAYPTTAGFAPRIDAFHSAPRAADEIVRRVYRNADAISHLSMPVVTLPLGPSAGGLPISLSLAGAWGNDRQLLALAMRLQPARARSHGHRLHPAEPPLSLGHRC